MYIIYERSKKEHGITLQMGNMDSVSSLTALYFKIIQILMGLLGRPFIWNLLFSASVQIIISKTL